MEVSLFTYYISLKSRDDSWLLNKKSVQKDSIYIDRFKKKIELETSSETFGRETELQRSSDMNDEPPSSAVPGDDKSDENILKSLPNSSSVSVIKGKRLTNVTVTPDPGQYEIDVTKIKHRDPKWSFAKQERNIYLEKENYPGPGGYEIKSTIGTGPKVYI